MLNPEETFIRALQMRMERCSASRDAADLIEAQRLRGALHDFRRGKVDTALEACRFNAVNLDALGEIAHLVGYVPNHTKGN